MSNESYLFISGTEKKGSNRNCNLDCQDHEQRQKKKKRAGSLDCVLYPILEKFVWSLKSKLRHNNNDCMRIGQKNVQFYCLINK